VGDDCTVLALTPELATEAARPFSSHPADPATYRVPFVAAPIARSAFAAVQRVRSVVARSGGFSHDAIREELYWLVHHVVTSGYGSRRSGRSAARRATTEAHRELAHAVIERVGRDVAANETLGELAANAYVSPFHMARIFRGTTGVPIHAYRTELRLRASLAPIADGERLADVAQQLGFASHAHLTDRFRRAYGMSPVEWRTQLHRSVRETRKNLKADPRRSLIA
jgi:AraC-like DNA-binding protein